jgi:xanthine dehydrogenase accessory factor
MEEMLRQDVPFIVATVIDVRGSAVAKPGAKAIIDGEGRPVFGWVGGGCVESFVCAESREALRAGAPRIITADLEDELSGVGLPCGGVMQIFLEPVIPRRRVFVFGESAAALEAEELLDRIGFAVKSIPFPLDADEQDTGAAVPVEFERGSLIIIASPEDKGLAVVESILEARPDYVAVLPEMDAQAQAVKQRRNEIKEESLESIDGVLFRSGLDLGGETPAEAALSVAAEMLAVIRGASARPLQETKMNAPVEAFQPMRDSMARASLVIAGHSNIAEELAWLADRLGWRVSIDSASAITESYPSSVNIIRDDADFTRLPASAETAVIVATHHKGDHLAIERAFEAGSWYVGLIASAHRSKIVRAMLEDSFQEDARMKVLRTPAGLDIGATSPAQIALSIMSEVVACFHGRTGEPRSTSLSYAESDR